jgi:hypothetical protein
MLVCCSRCKREKDEDEDEDMAFGARDREVEAGKIERVRDLGLRTGSDGLVVFIHLGIAIITVSHRMDQTFQHGRAARKPCHLGNTRPRQASLAATREYASAQDGQLGKNRKPRSSACVLACVSLRHPNP